MQLLISVNCSAKKTAAPVASLRARSLPRGTLSELATEWRARRSGANGKIAARRLYAGRGFSLAREVAKSTGAQLRVISAGMGLLHPDLAIPPYSLTLSPEAPDCILRRASRRDTFTPEQWWQAIRSQSPGASPFARLLKTYPKSLLLLAVTRPYLKMVTGELTTLTDANRNRIRIVGLTQPQTLPEELRSCAMPYDLRLNGAEGRLRGTALDFSSRALVHFVELVKLDRGIGDAASHARRVLRSLARWTAPALNPRKRIEDAALRREIRILQARNLSRAAGLRHLRGELGLACEQGRFTAAWGRK